MEKPEKLNLDGATQAKPASQMCCYEECQKEGKVRCLKCNMIWYCSSEHKKADATTHKPICNRLATYANLNKEAAMRPPSTKKTDQLEMTYSFLDFCKVVNKQFWDRYVINQPDRQAVIAFGGLIPKALERIEDLNTCSFSKCYKVDKPHGLTWFDSMQIFRDNGFSNDDFWTLMCLNKELSFCLAFVSAYRYLINTYNTKFSLFPSDARDNTSASGGDEIDFIALAEVLCVKKYDKIVVAFEWEGRSQENWVKEEINDNHKVILVKTVSGKRFLLDFMGPKYGIYQYDSNGLPFWMQEDVIQCFYKSDPVRILSPAQVDEFFFQTLDDCKTTKSNPLGKENSGIFIPAMIKEKIVNYVIKRGCNI